MSLLLVFLSPVLFCLCVFLSASVFISVSFGLLHCRIQQQDGSLLSKEKQRNAAVGVLVFPLGCTIWQSEAGAGRESEKRQVCGNEAGSEALE